LVNPLTKSIPHDVLLHTLTNTRNAVLKSVTPSKQEGLSQGGPRLIKHDQKSAIPR
jgi:hypothetical protein